MEKLIFIATSKKRISNLVTRLADLPQDIPADPIYSQIKDFTQKSNELKAIRDWMQSEKRQMTFTAIDRQGLIFKIRGTIQNLEKTPPELRRPIYSNVIKFAELYPTKLRMAVYAPTQSPETKKASGDSGGLMRDGSCTVSNGARERTWSSARRGFQPLLRLTTPSAKKSILLFLLALTASQSSQVASSLQVFCRTPTL